MKFNSSKLLIFLIYGGIFVNLFVPKSIYFSFINFYIDFGSYFILFWVSRKFVRLTSLSIFGLMFSILFYLKLRIYKFGISQIGYGKHSNLLLEITKNLSLVSFLIFLVILVSSFPYILSYYNDFNSPIPLRLLILFLSKLKTKYVSLRLWHWGKI